MHPGAGRRAGLVERDVRVATQAEDREVDRRGVEHRLVTRGLDAGIRGSPVKRVAAADGDARELAIQVRTEAARVMAVESEVLVQSQHRDVVAGQRSVGGVRAQRGIHATRRVARGQQRAHPRAGADPVRHQLGGREADMAGVVEDEQRRRCHLTPELAAGGGELRVEALEGPVDDARCWAVRSALAQLPHDGIEPADLAMDRCCPGRRWGPSQCSHDGSIQPGDGALKGGEPQSSCGKSRSRSATQAGCRPSGTLGG